MNWAKMFLLYLFKIYVLPVIQAELERRVSKLADKLIKSRYNATTIDDIDDLKWHIRDELTDWSESWTEE